MPRRPAPRTSSRYRLRATLLDIDPPVWRLFEAPGKLTLLDLHEVLQVVMGWENYHLFSFEIAGRRYGPPDPHGDLDFEDAGQVRLDGLALGKRKRILYEYDFGDSWLHELKIEAVRETSAAPLVQVLAGARACPPEDSGGPHGYADLLEALADPDHEEHDELREWAGKEFDPEAWSLEDTQREVDWLLGGGSAPEPGSGAKGRRPSARRSRSADERAADGEPLPAELEAEVERALDELLDALLKAMARAAAFDPRFPDPMFAGAAQLLRLFARSNPGVFLRARKPRVWGAAALHASSMLFVPYVPGHATLDEIARMWKVSSASVSARSLQLREGVRLESRPWPPMLAPIPRPARARSKPDREPPEEVADPPKHEPRRGRPSNSTNGNGKRPKLREPDPDQGSLF